MSEVVQQQLMLEHSVSGSYCLWDTPPSVLTVVINQFCDFVGNKKAARLLVGQLFLLIIHFLAE